MTNNGDMMRGWKWAVAVVIVLSILLFAVNQSSNTVQPSEQSQHTESTDTGEIVALLKDPEPVASDIPPQVTSISSVAKLAELSQQYIVQCEDPLAEYVKNHNEDDLPTREKVYQKWSESDVFELQFAFALAHSNSAMKSATDPKQNYEVQTKTLSALVENHPNSGIANYFLVSHCIASKDCNDSIFQDAIKQDPYNGALWKLVATKYAAQGEVEETLAALKKQITSANYNTYWGEAIHLYDQALLQIGMADFLPRQVMAIGFSSALALSPVKPIFDFCRQHSQFRADIAEACLKFGETQFQSGDSLIEQSLGLGLQKMVYEQLGSIEKANKVDNDKKAFGDAMGYISMATNLAMIDTDLNKYWWENILLYGETKALELTFTEAVRLSSDPDYNPCPNGKKTPNRNSE